jgi:hypothetical protein
MKRITATVIGVFALLVCNVFPAHAQHINVAEIAQGAVRIEGDQAKRNAPITWEGVVVTKTTNGGAFKFSTAILPQDCVGELNDGVTTVDVVIAGCTTQVSGGGVLKTGQTTIFATGDDGDVQAGVPVPNPRFTDNGDGTVTDNLTGLTWLKNVMCLGQQTWADALAAANALADGNGACGLADGSAAGDWRVPNRNELNSLLDLGTFNPALPAGHPFMNVAAFYWSSTTVVFHSDRAWGVFLDFGDEAVVSKTIGQFFTAVRGGS